MATKYLDYDGFEHVLEKFKKLIPDVSDFVTSGDLSDTLKNYAKSSDISGLVSSSELSSTLSNYVTSSSLNTTLANYAKSSDLDDYVKFTDYATTSKAGVMSADDKTYLDLLNKYIVETNPDRNYQIPLDLLSKFFGEFLCNNVALTSDSSALGDDKNNYENAEYLYFWDVDGTSPLFDSARIAMNYANAKHGGLMKAEDKSSLDTLWSAYQEGELGGNVDLSNYATKSGVVELFGQTVHEGFNLEWIHNSSTRELRLGLVVPDDFDSGDVTGSLHTVSNFNVVESDDIMSIKVLTSAEYSALGTKDSNTMYCITD